MTRKTDFFLGANSPQGFYSLYSQLGQADDTFDFIVLKGGPGVGKSTFMKQIGRQAEKQGLEVEYIRCSGDPRSLDALLLPQLRTVIADGTGPHVIEPKYPGAVDRYVNLGRFYDVDRLKERRREIIACTDGYQAEYASAYSCLRACRTVRQTMEESVAPWADREKLRRRLENVWQRERGKKRKERSGRERLRFLGGLTPAGRVCCMESVDSLCDRVYEIQDIYHLGSSALAELRRMILADGFDLITCLDPDCPVRIAHLLLPELKLAFLTADGAVPCREKSWRRFHVDRLIDREGMAALRGGLRLKERLAMSLEEEGAAHLRLAGEKHDELELIYRPFVDFDGVMAEAEAESRRIFA